MITPGSLDYLYHKGILDHIPYEAYEYGIGNLQTIGTNPYAGIKQAYLGGNYPMQSTVMNGSQYINAAQKGLLYNEYLQNNDSFIRRNPVPNNEFSFKNNAYGIYNNAGRDAYYSLRPYDYDDNIGRDADFEVMANGYEGKNFRQSIETAASSAKQSVTNAPPILKGLIAAALIIATPLLIIKGRKKPPIK